MTKYIYPMTLLLANFCFSTDIMAQDEHKLEAGCEATSEFQITQAGNRNFANLLRLNASFSMKNISLEAGSLSTYMTANESIGGDLQTYSNLDAGNIAFALSVCDIAWHTTDKQSLFLGIRNMNEDYFISPVTSFFTNSSCGIYPTISANYPIANYPLASVGIHYHAETEHIGINASVYNGKGYEKITGRESIFHFKPKDDGVFAVTDVQYSREESRYYIGSAFHCKDGISMTPWIYAEQRLNDNIALIAGYSHAFGKDVECHDFIGLGAHYEHRKCQWGIFADYANFDLAHEYATEITFIYNFTPRIFTQPTLHIISTHLKETVTQINACLRLGFSL